MLGHLHSVPMFMLIFIICNDIIRWGKFKNYGQSDSMQKYSRAAEQ